jgi:hypothetical protein
MMDDAGPLPEKLLELLDELDGAVRTVEVARVLTARQVDPQLAIHAVRALQHLLAGEREEAAQLFETLADEIHGRTVQMRRPSP